MSESVKNGRVPAVCKSQFGVVVPMPTLPAVSMVMRCVLLVVKLRILAAEENIPVLVLPVNEKAGAAAVPPEDARYRGLVTLVPMVGDALKLGAPAFAVRMELAGPCAVARIAPVELP